MEYCSRYWEMKFCRVKPRAMEALLDQIPLIRAFNDTIWLYGAAGKRFGRWEGAPQ